MGHCGVSWKSDTRTTFSGTRQGDDLARHYASGDLFLFPSKTDTFGNVVLEAMASGLAVVAFDDAAAAEHIRHGERPKAPLTEDSINNALRLADQPSLLQRIRAEPGWTHWADWHSQIEQFEQLVSTNLHRPDTMASMAKHPDS